MPYELPPHMAELLTAEERDILKQVETFAFDQDRCRMI